jgi:hypothetical protein
MKAKQIAAAMLALLAIAAASPVAAVAGPVKPLCGTGGGPHCSG